MLFKILSIYTLTCIFCFHYTQSLDIRDCGSYFHYEDIELDGCSEHDTACTLYIGSTTNISFSINTGKELGEFDIDADLISDVSFFVAGGPKFNLTATPMNPCEVLRCPLDVNYSAKYSAGIYVDTKYQPLGNAYLVWLLETADLQEQLLCFQIPITIQN